MTGRWTRGIALVAVFTLGAGAVSLATIRTSKHVTAHVAGGGSVMHATMAAVSKKKKTTVKRLESATLTVQPGAVDGADGTCPASIPHPISGYWGTDEPNRDGDLVVVRSTPVGSTGRTWEVSAKNVSAAPITMYVGTICIR